MFGLDSNWMRRRADQLRALTIPVYLGVERYWRNIPEIANARYIELTRAAERFSDNPGLLESGGNSGFAAFNLAYLKRLPLKVALFGFDYFENAGGHHYTDRYSWYAPGQNERYWKNWGGNFTGCRPQLKGTAVMNASPDSTVTAFQKCSIDDGLAWLIG